MFKWIRKYFPKKIQSGTQAFKRPFDVHMEMLNRLENLYHFDKICFWSKQCKGQVQMKLHHKGGILVGLKVPFKITKDTFKDIFLDKGIRIPDEWQLNKLYRWRKIIIFRILDFQNDNLAFWLDDIFKKIFCCPEDYQVVGKVDLGMWHYEDTNQLFE
jgi:hypothetical protein